MDGWIYKTAIFSEQMHQHRRQQEEENIAELHNQIIKLQFSFSEMNAYTVNTKNHNYNSIINNNLCMILYILTGVLKVSNQGNNKIGVSYPAVKKHKWK